MNESERVRLTINELEHLRIKYLSNYQTVSTAALGCVIGHELRSVHGIHQIRCNSIHSTTHYQTVNTITTIGHSKHYESANVPLT